ncbi:MAG TPA: hypothetical protein VFQ42_22355 [Mycobacterium sp.]|nr:hypothetical protein [Mycobacterium sp.]
MGNPQIDRAIGNALSVIESAARALTLELAANLTEASPVDTGHNRRNFVPSVGEPFAGEDDGTAQAAGIAAVLAWHIGDGDLYVTNNVPYLQYLLLGSSPQAAPGWDLIAMDAAVEAIRQAYGVTIDATSPLRVTDFGALAAQGIAAAYSPLGGDG